MHRHRAFCESLNPGEVTLVEAEAHHVMHVLRARPGDSLLLFDGAGAEAEAVITSTTRREVRCELSAVTRVQRPNRAWIRVAAAPPKGDRLKWMVEKLTEIGVDRLTLLQSSRTIVTPGETRLDKLKASVIAACKQSGRSVLMDLQPLTPIDTLLESPGDGDNPLRLMAHPGTESRPLSAVLATTERQRPLEILIGPEGGFTEEEVELAQRSGAIPVMWPGHILRIETAAVVFATLLIHSRPVEPD